MTNKTNYGKTKSYGIEAQFALPFSLFISISSEMIFKNKTYNIDIKTIMNEKVSFPGIEKANNFHLECDGTSTLEHSEIQLKFNAELPTNKSMRMIYCLDELSEEIVSATNHVISLSRDILERYNIGPTIEPWEINPILLKVDVDGEVENQALTNTPNGGLKNHRDKVAQHKILYFAYCLKTGMSIASSREVYTDAQRYLHKYNFRMALINICLYFEIIIKETLEAFSDKMDTAFPKSKNGSNWRSWALAKCAEAGFKTTLGYSLSSKNGWAEESTNTYQKIIRCRNSVMHTGKIHTDIFKEDGLSRKEKHEAMRVFFFEIDNVVAEIYTKFCSIKKDIINQLESDFISSLHSVLKPKE